MDLKRKITKRYTHGEMTVIWKPHLCIHSGLCVAGLPKVFDPSRHPWVDPMAAGKIEVRNQVIMCPSGALSLDPPPTLEDLKAELNEKNSNTEVTESTEK
jgi:uncharacterized Fe-S cluster protein YjdI